MAAREERCRFLSIADTEYRWVRSIDYGSFTLRLPLNFPPANVPDTFSITVWPLDPAEPGMVSVAVLVLPAAMLPADCGRLVAAEALSVALVTVVLVAARNPALDRVTTQVSVFLLTLRLSLAVLSLRVV